MKFIVVFMIDGIPETVPKRLEAKCDKLEIWVRVKSILTWGFVVSENIEKITGIFRKFAAIQNHIILTVDLKCILLILLLILILLLLITNGYLSLEIKKVYLRQINMLRLSSVKAKRRWQRGKEIVQKKGSLYEHKIVSENRSTSQSCLTANVIVKFVGDSCTHNY